jgi:2-haloacid dehalogenase
MTSRAIDAVVLDVLGTLVDEPSGLRAGIRALLPQAAAGEVDEALGLWQQHIETEQQSIVDGGRLFVNSEALDLEAAQLVADRFGVTDPASITTLGTAGQRLPPWPDSIAGLDRLADRLPLIGLSNASRAALLRLNAHAGLRWHQALSAEAARTYKPAPEVYRLAVETAARPPERLVMVAAHAWDLRGAQALGMRTAYVHRPVGDPPAASDRFDWHLQNLSELADHLHDVVG